MKNRHLLLKELFSESLMKWKEAEVSELEAMRNERWPIWDTTLETASFVRYRSAASLTCIAQLLLSIYQLLIGHLRMTNDQVF